MNRFLSLVKDKMSFSNNESSLLSGRFNNLKFKYKLIIGFLAVILIFLLGSGVNLFFLDSIGNNATLLEESGNNMYYVLKLATLIRAKYIDAVDLSNDNEVAIKRFYKHEKEFQEVVNRLEDNIVNKRSMMLLKELIAQNNEFNRIFTKELIPVYKIKHGEEVPEYNGLVNFKVPMIAIINTRDDLIHASNVFSEIFVDKRVKSLKQLGEGLNSTYTSSIISFLITIVIAGIIISLLEKNLVSTLQQLVDYSRQLAAGNLNVEKLKIETDDEIEELARAFNTMVDNLSELITNISGTSNQVAGFSQELSSLALESDATIDSASVIINEMSSGVDQVAANSQEVMEFSHEVVTITNEGDQKIKESIKQMQKIHITVEDISQIIDKFSQQSKEIGKITDLINQIAEQTNLLALNAAIEAARAGEHGRGFAVVAEEIRNLASETSKATGNIGSLIGDIQSHSKEAIKAIDIGKAVTIQGEEVIEEAGLAFDQVNEAVTETVSHIEETTASTEELAAGSQKVLEVTDEVSSISQEVTREADKLSYMAEDLNNLLQNFEI